MNRQLQISNRQAARGFAQIVNMHTTKGIFY